MATDDRALIQIKGAAELREALSRKKIAMQNMGNTFHRSVILIDRWIQKNFQTEGQLAYPGRGWQPLSQSTIMKKAGIWGKSMQRLVISAKNGKVSQRLINKIKSGKVSKDSPWLKNQGITVKMIGGYDQSGRITKRLAKRIAANKILQDKGQLRSRWKHYWDNRQAIVQSGVDYGIYHDSSEPRKKLPERKILPTEKQIMPELIKIFEKHIETSLDK